MIFKKHLIVIKIMLIKRHIYMWWTKRWKSMGGGDKKEGY
jgi:hypothetical protein